MAPGATYSNSKTSLNIVWMPQALMWKEFTDGGSNDIQKTSCLMGVDFVCEKNGKGRELPSPQRRAMLWNKVAERNGPRVSSLAIWIGANRPRRELPAVRAAHGAYSRSKRGGVRRFIPHPLTARVRFVRGSDLWVVLRHRMGSERPRAHAATPFETPGAQTEPRTQ